MRLVFLTLITLCAFQGFAQEIPHIEQAQEMTLRERLRGPRAGAHKGGLFHRDADTLHRFQKAIEKREDILATDLQITSDGIPILFHDDKLDRLTHCHGKVSERNFESIRHCHYKLNDETIPSFEELLQMVNGRAIVSAEFKTEDAIGATLRLVAQYNAYEWVYFETNTPDMVAKVRQYDWRVALSYSPHDREDLQWALDQNDPSIMIILLGKHLRGDDIIRLIHKNGKFVSQNAFYYSRDQELQGAACYRVYNRIIDIAISNRVDECVEQRDSWFKKHGYMDQYYDIPTDPSPDVDGDRDPIEDRGIKQK